MRAPRSVASLAGATLVASVVMVAGGAVSTANASGPAYVNAGNLTLITGTGAAADRWVYDKGTTSTKDDTVQPVNAVKGSCRLNYAAGALVRTAGVGGLPGYANHTIGVTQGSTSRTCARINPAVVRGTVKRESLVIALNRTSGKLFSPAFGAVLASSATLDISAVDDTQVKAETYRDGRRVGVFFLYGNEGPRPASLATKHAYCSTPDLDNDNKNLVDVAKATNASAASFANCTWKIPGPAFDTLKLTTMAGGAWLNGGGEWGAAAAKHRTTFSLVAPVAGALDCSASRSATATGTAGATLTGASVTRLGNAPTAGATPPCVAIPYTLDAASNVATFHKPATGSQSTAQFVVTLNRFYAKNAPFPVTVPLVDWEDGVGTHKLALCPAGLVGPTDTNGVPSSISSARLGTDQSTRAGLQFACVYNETKSYNSTTGALAVADYVYFTGDIKFPSA